MEDSKNYLEQVELRGFLGAPIAEKEEQPGETGTEEGAKSEQKQTKETKARQRCFVCCGGRAAVFLAAKKVHRRLDRAGLNPAARDKRESGGQIGSVWNLMRGVHIRIDRR
jgi:hypothetical protein